MARKTRSKAARQQLRQMNLIGLDNVKGYSPEVLQKLTPSAEKTFIEKKKSSMNEEEMLYKKATFVGTRKADPNHLDFLSTPNKTPVSSAQTKFRASLINSETKMTQPVI